MGVPINWTCYKDRRVVPGFGKYGRLVIAYDVKSGRGVAAVKGLIGHRKVWLDHNGEEVDFKQYSHWDFVDLPTRMEQIPVTKKLPDTARTVLLWDAADDLDEHPGYDAQYRDGQWKYTKSKVPHLDSANKVVFVIKPSHWAEKVKYPWMN